MPSPLRSYLCYFSGVCALLEIQAHSQNFCKGVSDLYVCMYDNGVWGYPSPGNFLKIRCSEIGSEAILGQAAVELVYATGLSEYFIQFWLSMYVHVCICIC